MYILLIGIKFYFWNSQSSNIVIRTTKFQLYLSHRTFQIKLANYITNHKRILFGIFQKSALCPTLSNMFTHDKFKPNQLSVIFYTVKNLQNLSKLNFLILLKLWITSKAHQNHCPNFRAKSAPKLPMPQVTNTLEQILGVINGFYINLKKLFTKAKETSWAA